MVVRNIIIILTIVILGIGCSGNGNSKNDREQERYIAVIDTSMTLMEVAKANDIGEPYLRTMLGIPKRIGKKYTVATMAKRFKFELEDLRKIIEDQKNKELNLKTQ